MKIKIIYTFLKVMGNIHKNNHKKSKCNSYKLDYTQSNSLLHNGVPIRPFSSTPRRRADPLSTTVVAFGSSHAPSLLSNPLGCAFVLLTGMATTLFYLVAGLPGFFAHDPSLWHILQHIDNMLCLCEMYMSYEQSGINVMLASVSNFSPEVLNHFYLSLQELVTAREALFSYLGDVINSPEIEFLPRPLVERIEQNMEDLRLGGNNLMALVRDIEVILNIPQAERIPSFWFED